MVEEPSVEDLVRRAADGDVAAWGVLVDRFAGLVWSVCRQYRMSNHDAADVSQTVWLRLVEQLSSVREPAAVGGWLVTTARRECLRVLGDRRRQIPLDLTVDQDVPDDPERTATDARLLADERDLLLRRALAELPDPCRSLLSMLVAEDRKPYAEIGRELGMPIGSIGPTRSRCLDRIRKNATVVALLDLDPASVNGK
jgi:RNA polymerase sigma factor (sigma-70 family)